MRRLTWTFAVVSLVAMLSAFALWRELDHERQRADALQARVVTLETARAAAPGAQAVQPVSVIAASVATSAPPGQAPTNAAAGAEAQQAAMQASFDDWRDYQQRMLSNPKYREAHKAQRKLELGDWREDGIRLLGMTPEQADKVLDYHVEAEIESSSRPNPRDETAAEQRRRDIAEAERRREAALREILGEAKAVKWQEYLESQPSRNEVRQLRMQLSSSGDPLRDDQVEPLIATLHAERMQFVQALNDFRETLNWEAPNWEASNAKYLQHQSELYSAANERFHDVASQFLSQQQLAAFDEIRAQKLEMQLARERVNRARAAVKQPAVAKGN
jgi:hypothetical protein